VERRAGLRLSISSPEVRKFLESVAATDR